jgi:hypothetical protein
MRWILTGDTETETEKERLADGGGGEEPKITTARKPGLL